MSCSLSTPAYEAKLYTTKRYTLSHAPYVAPALRRSPPPWPALPSLGSRSAMRGIRTLSPRRCTTSSTPTPSTGSCLPTWRWDRTWASCEPTLPRSQLTCHESVQIFWNPAVNF